MGSFEFKKILFNGPFNQIVNVAIVNIVPLGASLE